jgi:hypothetical protein
MGVTGRVPFSPQFQGWVISIYRRLGYSETIRRLGISERTLTIWLGKNPKRSKPLTLRKENAIAIVKLMDELRKSGEVRHRFSIHRGAKIRGEKERPVYRNSDLLHRSDGDADTEARRLRRQRARERLAKMEAA